jgi:hypothetical protein
MSLEWVFIESFETPTHLILLWWAASGTLVTRHFSSLFWNPVVQTSEQLGSDWTTRIWTFWLAITIVLVSCSCEFWLLSNALSGHNLWVIQVGKLQLFLQTSVEINYDRCETDVLVWSAVMLALTTLEELCPASSHLLFRTCKHMYSSQWYVHCSCFFFLQHTCQNTMLCHDISWWHSQGWCDEGDPLVWAESRTNNKYLFLIRQTGSLQEIISWAAYPIQFTNWVASLFCKNCSFSWFIDFLGSQTSQQLFTFNQFLQSCSLRYDLLHKAHHEPISHGVKYYTHHQYFNNQILDNQLSWRCELEMGTCLHLILVYEYLGWMHISCIQGAGDIHSMKYN